MKVYGIGSFLTPPLFFSRRNLINKFICFREPLFVFDTTSSVGDIRWAPYSSSVLAAVTLDCKAYVFDLNVDKYRPICIQTILSKKVNKLTKVAFNLKLPVVVVGDDK